MNSLPQDIDSPGMRSAGPELLSLALMDARNYTLQLLGYGADPGAKPQSRPADPLAPWRIAGRIGWLADWWIVRNPQRQLGRACPAGGVRLASSVPWADACFHPRAGTAEPVPQPEAIRQWLLDTLEATLELLERSPGDDRDLDLFRAVLFHEDAQGEVLIGWAQDAGLALPLSPPVGRGWREPLVLPGVRWQAGLGSAGFSFDLDRPGHEVRVPEFEIDAQPVDWGRFVEFVADGGYDRQELWLAQGWDWLQQLGRRAPAQVEQIGVGSGAVAQSWFGRTRRMASGQPVVHATWWEADAYARWAGRRLPTEIEWEVAASTAARRGFHWGDVHEWTAGLLRPWPGWEPDAWAEGTPFDAQSSWGQARARRGASFATRARMKHAKLRGFGPPQQDLAFTGFRTCAP